MLFWAPNEELGLHLISPQQMVDVKFASVNSSSEYLRRQTREQKR